MKKYNLFDYVLLKDQPKPNLAFISGFSRLENHYIVSLLGWTLEDGSTTKLVHASELEEFDKAPKPHIPPSDVKPTINKPLPKIPNDYKKWVEWIGEWDDDNPPYIPYYPSLPTVPYPMPNDAIGKCPVCGRDMFQLDMYCCMNPGCPSRTTVTC